MHMGTCSFYTDTDHLVGNFRIIICDCCVYNENILGCVCFCLYDLQTLRCLLDNGANVNKPNNNGWTPLHFACKSVSYTSFAANINITT